MMYENTHEESIRSTLKGTAGLGMVLYVGRNGHVNPMGRRIAFLVMDGPPEFARQ